MTSRHAALETSNSVGESSAEPKVVLSLGPIISDFGFGSHTTDAGTMRAVESDFCRQAENGKKGEMRNVAGSVIARLLPVVVKRQSHRFN